MAKRLAINVSVSQEAYDGWRGFAAVHGSNVTALVEAIGRTLASLDDPEANLPPLLRTTVQQSRLIDAERRSRRREGGPAAP
jgi:hypothetical protein